LLTGTAAVLPIRRPRPQRARATDGPHSSRTGQEHERATVHGINVRVARGFVYDTRGAIECPASEYGAAARDRVWLRGDAGCELAGGVGRARVRVASAAWFRGPWDRRPAWHVH